MFLRGKRALALLCAASWAGCSVFGTSSDDNAPPTSQQPDGGPGSLAPVTGTALGNYDLAVDITAVRHGIPAIAKIAVTRKPPFDRIIRVDLKDPPAGVTAERLELAPNATSGELKIIADGTVPQGPLTLTVRANVPETTLDDLVIPKDVAIQGAPGELDTSFGDKGVFFVPNVGTQRIVALEGERFVESGVYQAHTTILSAYSGSQTDTQFADAGSLVLSHMGLDNIVWTQGRLFVAGTTPKTIIESRATAARFLPTGQIDTAFPTYFNSNILTRGLAVNPNGRVAVVGKQSVAATTPGWMVAWIDANGNQDTSINQDGLSHDGTPPFLSAASYAVDTLYAVGSDTAIALRTTGGSYDATFGTSGRLAFPGAASLVSTVLDGKGRLLVGGLGGSGAFVGRVSAGKLDATFGTQGYTSYGPNVTSGGSIALQSDGSVLQLVNLTDGAGNHCALLRRRDDGSLDPSFGLAGVASLSVSDCTVSDLAVTADDKVLLGGPKTLRVWL